MMLLRKVVQMMKDLKRLFQLLKNKMMKIKIYNKLYAKKEI